MAEKALHRPVLFKEALAALDLDPAGICIDATFGRGGHSRGILDSFGATGRLIAVDRDPQAVAAATIMQNQDTRLEAVHAKFSQLEEIAVARNVHGKVDGVLFDLGLSSPQLDTSARGFSFRMDGPLDMRMNPQTGKSAAQWLDAAGADEIADVLWRFGEERHARRIARHIVREREAEPIRNTGRLADIVKQANPAWEKEKHPATRTFQAIRIFINDELAELEQGLEQALAVLGTGGRLVVIAFHSLEDGMVRRFMTKHARGDDYPRHLPVPAVLIKPRLRQLGKVLRPRPSEVQENPRARSALMRVAKKIAPAQTDGAAACTVHDTA